ncbi:MAG: HTTM domain-containing protein, partial [Planctomycetes bacterium]|nr:HTTM domain-containing protein [Planctomycetota bacterium]
MRKGWLLRSWDWLLCPVASRAAATANPSYVAAFRICYGLIALAIAAQSIQYTDIRWFSATSETVSLVWFVNVLWVPLLVLLVLGLGGRFVILAHLIVTPILLDGTVGTDLLCIGAFWLLFMRADEPISLKGRALALLGRRRPAKPCPAWPLVLMGINLGILMFFAGISKAFDPLWRNGWGFYYTFLQPWIKWPEISFLAESKTVMVVMNYCTIATELLVLPLMFFRRTRAIAVILFAATYGLLTFVFRIDPIGPVGLAMAIGLVGVTPRLQRVVAGTLRIGCRSLANVQRLLRGRQATNVATEQGPVRTRRAASADDAARLTLPRIGLV